MIINKINLINPARNYFQKNKNYTTNPVNNNGNITEDTDNLMHGIPASYITFKSRESDPEFKYAISGQRLLENAFNIVERFEHKEVTPYHIILASIEETEEKLNYLAETKEPLEEGSVVSPLHMLVNNFAKKDVLVDPDEQEFFLEALSDLKNKTLEELAKQPKFVSEPISDIDYSKNFKKTLKEIETEINDIMLLGAAFNTLTYEGVNYPGEFLIDFQSLGLYKTSEEVNSYYLENYDSKAIDIWNKLALGSNLFVLSKNIEDKGRVVASFINTINASKHGNFNDENTFVYTISENAEPKALITEIEKIQNSDIQQKLIFIIDLDDMMPNLVEMKAEGSLEYKAELFKLINLAQNNTKFILLQNENSNYQLMLTPQIKKAFNNFINYNIPPIQSYEVNDILRKNKNLLKDVKKPFKPDAKEKAIILAGKMEGAYPDKAIELMRRISEYYGDEVSKISTKDVDEFAYIAGDIFKSNKQETSIVYNTGKTLATYYGKETTKKDIENIVKQIKTGRIGTKGYIISSRDEEAGAGKKHTAEVIAGEAKIPILEVNSSDFALNDSENISFRVNSAQNMSKIFADIKLAAKQNPYKTAILFIENFEDLVFSDSYYSGYKQAKTQLTREMEKAMTEDINILVMGSTREDYTEYMPLFIKDFSQNIIVDSPAFNKKSRKDVLTNIIAKEKLPLSYKTKSEKEDLIEKLVKITEYCSYVQIKNLISKTQQIMLERDKNKAGIGEFIEAYLQLETGRTSQPEMPMYNKMATTSHECGHATNLEIMNRLYESKGQPWHKSRDVNFITLDPRGNFLGAVFEGKTENTDYPFEAMFSDLVCSYGGYSCEKLFFNMDGSSGISQDLAQATAAVQRAIEYFGLGYYTGKISNAVKIKSGVYHENVYKDMNIILTNAQIASDLITEGYKDFNTWFTSKYSKLIGTDNCMIDGDDFRKQLTNWIASQSTKVKEELAIIDDMILDIIKASKNGKMYYQAKKVIK